ncbi:MAG TPA: hypothetical protein VKB03_02160 [Conexibacter sp.]|nr:hypothetical protein [Conexibacter sp.]
MSEREAIRRELVGLVERSAAPIEAKRRPRKRAPSAEWWLTRSNRGASCDDCSAWLREGAPIVFCAIGPRRLCRGCAKRRAIRWRAAESMRRARRAGKAAEAPSLDARATTVLDALRQRAGVVGVEELRAATGLRPATLGGVLSRLKALGLASRHGRRGWSARGGSRGG